MNKSSHTTTWGSDFRAHLNEQEQGVFDLLDKTAYRYMPVNARSRMADVLSLRDAFDQGILNKGNIFDWQILIMPACLAVEETLFKIADEIGISYGPQPTIGAVYHQRNIEQVTSKIEDEKKSAQVSTLLGHLTGFIQLYRNDPMHASTTLLVKSYGQALNKIGAMTEWIKSLIESLVEAQLIEVVPKPKISEAWGTLAEE